MIKMERCSVCRSRDTRLVTKDIPGNFKGRPYVTPDVTCYECYHCGEDLLDAETARYVESFQPPVREAVE